LKFDFKELRINNNNNLVYTINKKSKKSIKELISF